MTRPKLQALAKNSPESFRGFDESMSPNVSFRDEPCSLYGGTKALGEEAVEGVGQNFIHRLRSSFDEIDKHRKYLTKIHHHAKVYNNLNSLFHRASAFFGK